MRTSQTRTIRVIGRTTIASVIVACSVVACGPAGQTPLGNESGANDQHSPIGTSSAGIVTNVFAVNIDPNNGPAWAQSQPSRLRSEGFRGVRLTSRRSIQTKIDELKRQGLAVMAIITSESQGYVPWNADYLQIGNEPDVTRTYMSPSAYANMWVIYRNTYPQFSGRFVMAGLASGGLNAVNYARAVFNAIGGRAPLPDILAIHPYAKTTPAAAGDFDLMWNNFHRPIIATEWHNEDDTWNFQCMLGNRSTGRSTVWNSVFCYSDYMESGKGLRRADPGGTPKPFYYSLLSAPANCR